MIAYPNAVACLHAREQGEVKVYEEKLVLFQEGKTGQKEEQELQQV